MAMRVNVVNEDPSVYGRRLGLIYDAVALVWAARTGQTSPTIIAGLTNKHVPTRLVKEKLLQSEAVQNPQSPAQFKLGLTKKGFVRAVELLARIRKDLNLRAMAEKMGFALILLDKFMPKMRIGGANKWRFAHDIKLQMCMAAYIRHQQLMLIMPRSAAGNPIVATEMRTSVELDRITVKTGEEKIADWTYSGRAPGEFGKARLYLELENSKQSTADYARRVYFYNTRLHKGEGALQNYFYRYDICTGS